MSRVDPATSKVGFVFTINVQRIDVTQGMVLVYIFIYMMYFICECEYNGEKEWANSAYLQLTFWSCLVFYFEIPVNPVLL